MSAEAKPAVIKNRVKRSDTEPLLPVNTGPAKAVGRSTAFKENISLSPVKPLPPINMFETRNPYGSRLPSRSYASGHGWSNSTDGWEHAPQESELNHTLLQMPRYDELSGPSVYSSSPAYRSSKNRRPTPGAVHPEPVQRWNSQPVLTNVTNRRHSQHGEIKQRRLMSEIQPVPPTSPNTPLSEQAALTKVETKHLNNSGPVRLTSQQSPSIPQSAAQTKAPAPRTNNQQAEDTHPAHRQPQTTPITQPEPPAYWCGRFAALTDRYRTEDLATHLHRPTSQTSAMHSPEANTRRMRRALEHLHALCGTPEARESFAVFQRQVARVHGVPELARPMRVVFADRRCEDGGEEEDGGGAVSYTHLTLPTKRIV